MTPTELRSALPRAWPAFLARFGTPSAIQLAAAAPLLEGRDALLCAPTASGKTEAYLAPLCERIAPMPSGRPRVLVVSPTRALVNDLYRRIEPPLRAMNVGSGRWTGDAHDGGELHPVTVLTPEALDSRLSRAPDQLTDVIAVVMDELHVLDDTARGDQLRILVQRLRLVVERGAGTMAATRGRRLQVVAASATVADPTRLAARYLSEGAAIVRVDARRRVLARIVDSSSLISLQQCLVRELERGFRKVIAFCDSREDVETTVRFLRGQAPFGDAVLAHHGSLARPVRLSSEKRFLDAPVALCVATSTLELGIDIGTIDLVVMIGVPPDVQALLQRIGRGGRRQEGVHTLCVADGAFRASMFRTLLLAQKAGEWHVQPGTFRPSVLVQQAVSMLQSRQSRTIDAAAIVRRLPPDLATEWTEDRVRSVLAQMEKKGWLERGRGGAYGLGAKADALWRRVRLHANIDSAAEVAVTDALTGDVVGSVATVSNTELGLGGKGRRIVQNQGERVVTEADSTAALGSFGGGAMKPTNRLLASAFLVGAGIAFPSRVILGGRIVYFHGLGTAAGALVGEVLKRAGYEVVRAGRFAAVVARAADWPGVDTVGKAMATRSAAIGRVLDLGAWHHLLPPGEQAAAVAARCEIEAVKEFFGREPDAVLAADQDVWEEAGWG